jgi:hypothetical protein
VVCKDSAIAERQWPNPCLCSFYSQEPEDLLADLTPALLNSAWQLLTADARRTLMASAHSAAAAAAAVSSSSAAAAEAVVADARPAAFSLTTALEVVSFGEQRTFFAAPPLPADAEDGGAEAVIAAQDAAWAVELSTLGYRRATLAASAALAVRNACLAAPAYSGASAPSKLGALAAGGPAAPGGGGNGSSKRALPLTARLSVAIEEGLRLLFLAAMGDVAFFPEVWAVVMHSSQVNHECTHFGGRVWATRRCVRGVLHSMADAPLEDLAAKKRNMCAALHSPGGSRIEGQERPGAPVAPAGAEGDAAAGRLLSGMFRAVPHQHRSQCNLAAHPETLTPGSRGLSAGDNRSSLRVFHVLPCRLRRWRCAAACCGRGPACTPGCWRRHASPSPPSPATTARRR